MLDPTFLAPLLPLADAALRIAVGFLLIPHGLRFAFGMFPDTGNPNQTIGQLARSLDAWGYRPGWLWAPMIAVNHLVAGPLLVLGLFTRPVAFILSGQMAAAYFMAHAPQNFLPLLNGGESAILFCFIFLYLAAAGGGAWSLDAARKA